MEHSFKPVFDRALAERGFKGSIVSIRRVRELKEEIQGRYKEGRIDKELYGEYLEQFESRKENEFPKSGSVFLVASPQPQIVVSFAGKNGSFTAIIPPIYTYSTDKQATETIESVLKPTGYRLERAKLPFKLPAVRSGLAKYGINNIAYVPGMGSFCRFAAFYSDLPCEEDSWGELRVMPECEKCGACIEACPTGAVNSNRFLIRAERCITFHNERAGEFPDWLDRSWHNALVGCLHCQTCCPMNRRYIRNTKEGAVFSADETELLMKSALQDPLPESIEEKLNRMEITEDVRIIQRNLKVLLGRA